MNNTETTGTKLPLYQVIIYSFFTTVLCVFTCLGNLMVIISVGIEVRLRSISNCYIVSLAIADFLIGAVSIPLYSTFLITTYWPFGSTVCDLWLSLDYTLSNASVANILVISYDRYKTITCPLTYRVKRTMKRSVISIIVAWIISALIWTPFIYIWPVIQGNRTVHVKECYIQFIGSSRFITLFTVCIAYFVPLLIIVIFSIKIYLVTLRRHKHLRIFGCNTAATVPRVPSSCKNDTNTAEHRRELGISSCATIATTFTSIDTPCYSQHATSSIKTKKISNKAVKTLAAIIITFFVTWFPYNIFTLINSVGGSKWNPIIGSVLYSIGYYLCYVNSTINPILYACCNVLFRKTFWRILTCDRCTKVSDKFNFVVPNR